MAVQGGGEGVLLGSSAPTPPAINQAKVNTTPLLTTLAKVNIEILGGTGKVTCIFRKEPFFGG